MSQYITHHIPILLEPITDFLTEHLMTIPPAATPGVILDCTFGGGGHSSRILEKLAAQPLNAHRVIGIDQDPEAIERGNRKFAAEISAGLLELVHAPFSKALNAVKGRPIYGLMADLGISSDQIDSDQRGFSFRFPAPLDMRMNPSQGESLAEFLARASEAELSDVIWKYGEDRFSRKIARKLVQLRGQGKLPATTSALAEAIASVFPPPMRFKRIHPATQSFQAFRIFLNRELDELDFLLTQILPKVESGGHIAVLSFHSLEDRKVKETLRNKDFYDLPQRKAIKPSEVEIEQNSRSRSAKLRLAVRK